MKRITTSFFYLILASTLMAGGVHRLTIQYNPPIIQEKNHTIYFELNTLEQSIYRIREVRLYYREKGQADFRWTDFRAEGFRYLAALDIRHFHSPVLEYYYDITFTDGAHQTYPETAPAANLLSVALPQVANIDENIVIISPEPGEEIYTDELVITVSFPRYRNQVDPERIHLWLDNSWDVSKSSFFKVFDDFLSFSPRGIPPGRHTIKLELFDRAGKLLSRSEWYFVAHRRVGMAAGANVLNVTGSAYLESRNENLQNGASKQSYNRAGLDMNGSYGNFLFGSRLFISNQEKATAQPVNRYSLFLQYDFWNNRHVRLDLGDSYPQYSPIALQNIFVRGISGQLYLKFLNFDFAHGYIQRAIEEHTTTFSDTSSVVDTVKGTFQRNLTALRLSFGARDKFQLGFSYLKGKDDTTSVKTETAERPKENIVLGTDIYLATPRKNFVLEGYVNASFNNSNIRGGSIPFDSLRSFLPDSGKGLKSLYDLANRFITINQYLNLLPTFAYMVQARARYFGNYLSAVFQRADDGYFSMGQPYLLADYQTIQLNDNINLFQNQVFLTVGFQFANNNVKKTKSTTTNSRTVYFNLSYFPSGHFPSITFGYNNYNRNNGLQFGGPDTLELPENNSTNTINGSIGYTVPFGQLDNQVTVNFMRFNQKDAFYATGNSLSNLVTLNWQTRFQFPLIVNLELQVQSTQNAAGTDMENKIAFNSFGLGLEYRLPSLLTEEDELLASFNTRFGNFNSLNTNANVNQKYNRAFVSSRLIYRLPRYGRVSLNADLVNYTGDLQYKDYIITARYDISF